MACRFPGLCTKPVRPRYPCDAVSASLDCTSHALTALARAGCERPDRADQPRLGPALLRRLLAGELNVGDKTLRGDARPDTFTVTRRPAAPGDAATSRSDSTSSACSLAFRRRSRPPSSAIPSDDGSGGAELGRSVPPSGTESIIGPLPTFAWRLRWLEKDADMPRLAVVGARSGKKSDDDPAHASSEPPAESRSRTAARRSSSSSAAVSAAAAAWIASRCRADSRRVASFSMLVRMTVRSGPFPFRVGFTIVQPTP
mmetsp:Transcript_45770/g.117101  ORF Transcript_45770/g.117101 Transcript_45770/m.117101 type:complete len:257 (-) Transcript_45770:1316-2086(-)